MLILQLAQMKAIHDAMNHQQLEESSVMMKATTTSRKVFNMSIKVFLVIKTF